MCKIFEDLAGTDYMQEMTKEEVFNKYKKKHVFVLPKYDYKSLWNVCKIVSVVLPENTDEARKLLIEKYNAVVMLDTENNQIKYISKPFNFEENRVC